jgi:hypothetical protein
MNAIVRTILLSFAVAQAAPALAGETAASPFLGSWAVDVTQLPIPAEVRPKSVTFTHSDAGEGRWSTVVEIVAADGAVSRSETIHALDGTPAPVTNSIEADLVAFSNPSPDVLIMALSNKGQPSSLRVYTIAPDGRSQTETAVYYSPEGVPAMRPAYFTRIQQ